MSIEIQQLQAPGIDRLPDPITVQAAELLIAEVLSEDGTVADLVREAFIEHMGDEHRRVYAVVDGPQVLAAIAIELAPNYTFITALATHPDHRRQGHAGALICRIAEETIAHDVTGENPVTSYTNTPVPELYAKFGFREVTEDDYTELVASPQTILSRRA